MDEKMNVDKIDFFNVGKKVKVKQGPLKGMEGSLIQKSNRSRLVIAIDGIKQSLTIDIDYRDLEIIKEGWNVYRFMIFLYLILILLPVSLFSQERLIRPGDAIEIIAPQSVHRQQTHPEKQKFY